MRADLVLHVDTVDERIRREILSRIFLEDWTALCEVGIAATETSAEARILVFHQTFNAGILKDVEVGMEAVELAALVKNVKRLWTAGKLRVSHFMSDEQVVLVNSHVVPLRQNQDTVLNIEHGSRHVLVTDCDVLTCQQFRETAFGLVKMVAVVADGGVSGIGSRFFNVHKLIILNGAESVKAPAPVSPLE